MATPNFQSPANADKYYVVLSNREEKYKECDECNYKMYESDYELEKVFECEDGCEDTTLSEGEETIYPESWDYEDLKEDLGYSIKDLGGIKQEKVLDSSRYSVVSLGYLQESKYFGDLGVVVTAEIVLRGAYYEGATLDYILTIDSDFENFKNSTGSYYDEDLIEIMMQIFDPRQSDMNRGMLKIQSKNAVRWAERVSEEMGEKLNKIFELWSEHKLVCIGVFSNGEAIYE